MNAIKLFIVLVFTVQVFSAQQDSTLLKSANAKALKRLGQNAMKQKDPSTAVFYLESAVQKNKKDADAKFLLAMAYLETRDYERSQRMFLNAYTSDGKKVPEALFYHALMQKSNSIYDSASLNFRKFKKIYKGKNKVLKKRAMRESVFCDSISKVLAIKNKVFVQHLDSSINKVNTEGAPLPIGDNTMVFTSLRTNKKEFISEDEPEPPIKRKLYVASRINNNWKFQGEFGEVFNDDDFNTGNACLNPEGNRLYFTRCKENQKGEMICAIYVSEKNGASWSEPVKLPKEINHPKYTSTMPAVASDPAKGNEVLFFVSNRSKGKGKLDIWYSVYVKKTGTFKAPRNAGIKINSTQNEISPFFDNSTRTLYFSSDGQGGLGGYDIFRSKGNGSKWEQPENIGQPYNSGADDIYYTLSPNRKEGFFVSNRKGGNALKNRTCCDDIYSFKKTDFVNVDLFGHVSEMTDADEKIKDAVVEIYIKDNSNGEKFLVSTVLTDRNGRYSVKLEPGNQYYLHAKKDDFFGTSMEVSTMSITTSKTIRQDLQLIRKPKTAVRLPDVRYKSDRWELTTEAKLLVDSSLYRMMVENPEVIIEIQAHTDNHGSDSYNLKLSQKRAEGVVNYLISKGIDERRLRAKGFGETMPLAPNEFPDGRDNPEGRAINRRTDFKIVGVVDAELLDQSEIK
ncbi:MAG TPA: OmpA family protein [Bacteroidia bacterium]|nr:OmpA family protein [Bacteroidia bacterium]